jgi:diaminohydroxyphosphoribosylaminopyrimidine deaminase/5-amino-6-(5-phosphoribosylamino)uracil reductase
MSSKKLKNVRAVEKLLSGEHRSQTRKVFGYDGKSNKTSEKRNVGPCERALCERLNRGFISVRTKQRPWITLKGARTKDGRIANDDGSPLKITTRDQDTWSHTFLRAQLDAIAVGIGTVLHDNPSLTPRFASQKPGLLNTKVDQHQPYRIVFDAHLKIPLEAKLVTDEWKEKTIIITNNEASQKKEDLQKRGVNVFSVPVSDGFFVWEELWKVLTTPTKNFHGLTSILVEGGTKTWEVFRKNKMMDEDIVLMGK